MKQSLFFVLLLGVYSTTAWSDSNFLTCDQIKTHMQITKVDIQNVPLKSAPQTEVKIPISFKVSHDTLLINTMYFTVGGSFLLLPPENFNVNSTQFVFPSDVILDQELVADLNFKFHGGTNGIFELSNLKVTFINRDYDFVTCDFPIQPVVIEIENKNIIDMVPPEITNASISKEEISGHWQLHLNIRDDSDILLFEASDDFVPHFTLLNLDTNVEIQCYNKNLRKNGHEYLVDLFVSRADDGLIAIEKGNYQLVGFNRSDIFGNFSYKIAHQVEFVAENQFYCRDQR